MEKIPAGTTLCYIEVCPECGRETEIELRTRRCCNICSGAELMEMHRIARDAETAWRKAHPIKSLFGLTPKGK